MTIDRYDAIIIGTGQAGKPLAHALAKAGWETAVIERRQVGGTCINYGCTPTKTMVASARVAYLARRAADYGVETGKVSVDLEVVQRRQRSIVDSFRDSGREGLQEQDGIDLVFGEARFSDDKEIEVVLAAGGSRRLAADTIFVNSGSRPSQPPIEGLEDVGALDNESILQLQETPEHLLVIGGGYVGLEFGQMFRRFGSEVTILQRSAQLLSREDDDIAEAVTDILRDEGIEVLLGSKVGRVGRSGNGVEVEATVGGEERMLTGSHLLLATGRQPNTDALGLENTGIEIDESGYIEVDERLQTRIGGVYALGEVNGGPAFTHISYDDFRIVRTNLLDGGEADTRGRLVPYAVFIDPQLGRVGATERELRDQGRKIRIARLPMSSVARAIEVDETRGLMKAVVDADSDRILGAAVLGLEGGETMSVLEIAMMADLPYTALRDGIFAHPTLAESLNNLFANFE